MPIAFPKRVSQLLKRVRRLCPNLGQLLLPRTDFACNTRLYGSEYGGWNVVTDLLAPDSVVYSCGVGEDVSFDLALIKNHHVTVHAFDPTPRSIRWVKHQRLPAKFVMHDCGVADFDGIAPMYLPANPKYVSGSLLGRPSPNNSMIEVPVRRLSTIMSELGHDRIDLLKMDVEGAEYAVLDDMEAADILPSQILVEFHHRFRNVGVLKTIGAARRLRGRGYRLCSVSATRKEYCFVHESGLSRARN